MNATGQEVHALEAVLLGNIVDATKTVEPLPAGVVAGMRCPDDQEKDCTLFVVNTTPREDSFQLVGGGSVNMLAPFGINMLPVPR